MKKILWWIYVNLLRVKNKGHYTIEIKGKTTSFQPIDIYIEDFYVIDGSLVLIYKDTLKEIRPQTGFIYILKKIS